MTRGRSKDEENGEGKKDVERETRDRHFPFREPIKQMPPAGRAGSWQPNEEGKGTMKN